MIEQFGAVPTTEKDSRYDCADAIQQVIDTGQRLEALTPGWYYISKPLRIDQHGTVIDFGRGSMENIRAITHDDGWLHPSARSAVRLWTDQNIPFFEIRAAQFGCYGGVFDTASCLDHDKAVFHYLFDSPVRFNGWGGEILDFSVVGSPDTLANPGKGTIGILLDFKSAEVEGAAQGGYITHCRWRGTLLFVGAGFVSTALAEGKNQFANQGEITLDIDGCKKAVELDGIHNCKLILRTQARHVIPESESLATAVVIKTDGNVVDSVLYDASSTVSAEGLLKLSQHLRNDGRDNRLVSRLDSTVNHGDIGDTWKGTEIIDGAVGIIPRARDRSRDGVIISELHNLLLDFHYYPGAAYRFAAYKGCCVADFSTMTDESAGAESTEAQLVYFEDLFDTLRSLPGPSAKFTAQGVADGDYLELVLDLNQWIRFSVFWAAVSRHGSGFNRLQLLTFAPSGAVVDNKLIDTSAGTTGGYFRAPALTRLLPAGDTISKAIVRFIAPVNTKAVYIEDVGMARNSERHTPIYAGRHGGDFYRTPMFRDGMRMGKYKLWVDAGGVPRIKKGTPEHDRDGAAFVLGDG